VLCAPTPTTLIYQMDATRGNMRVGAQGWSLVGKRKTCARFSTRLG
jgi:hypothetical protein